MPPPKSKDEPVVIEHLEPVTTATELELLQVDLGDMVKLKQVLDEAVAAAVLEHLKEDTKWDNFKLLLMTTACLFAMVAQFAPIPFPESRPILGVCGSVYFILSGVLQFITTYLDKDSILLTKPSPDCKNKDLATNGVRVRSNLPRFSEWYTVVLEVVNKDNNPNDKRVEQVWSVGQFFDKEGYFDEVGLGMEVDKLYKRLLDGKYTTPMMGAAKDKKKN